MKTPKEVRDNATGAVLIRVVNEYVANWQAQMSRTEPDDLATWCDDMEQLTRRAREYLAAQHTGETDEHQRNDTRRTER